MFILQRSGSICSAATLLIRLAGRSLDSVYTATSLTAAEPTRALGRWQLLQQARAAPPDLFAALTERSWSPFQQASKL